MALDENGLHAAAVEEGLLWVWMQTERDRELLEVNPDSSWGNGSYYWVNFMYGQPDLPHPDNDPQGHTSCVVYHDYQQLSLSPPSK